MLYDKQKESKISDLWFKIKFHAGYILSLLALFLFASYRISRLFRFNRFDLQQMLPGVLIGCVVLGATFAYAFSRSGKTKVKPKRIILTALLICAASVTGFFIALINPTNLALKVDSLESAKDDALQQGHLFDPKTDFVDLTFTITNKDTSFSDPTWVKAEGILNGKPVGIMIELHDKTSAVGLDANGKVGITSPSVKNGVVLKSIGVSSDNLTSGYAELFGHSEPSATFKDNLAFTSIALDRSGLVPAVATTKYKLFFDTDFSDLNSPEAKDFYNDSYFEMYLTVDLQDNLVWLGEKDISYRPQMLKAFTKL